MTQVIHLLVFFKVSIESTSTHIQLTNQQVVSSIMLLVTKVLHLMMLVCSTAHTFLYRWFVQLEKIHSSQKSALRLVTESLRTHLPKVMFLTKVLVDLRLIQTVTTEEFKLRTLCKKKGYISFNRRETLKRVSFFV